AHRAYLARGGLTTFLGDGSLRYGAERAAELYYDADLGAGLRLAADVQRVVHPGYDAARGPVSFYGLRLHWEV
ncbi:MAG TPA: carbohydrate porin, partial [Burkholderiaceae bacterium]